MGTAGLRASSRQPFSTKWLRPYNGADLVAVHVHIANPDPSTDFANCCFNARVKAEREAKTRSVQTVANV